MLHYYTRIMYIHIYIIIYCAKVAADGEGSGDDGDDTAAYIIIYTYTCLRTERLE